jgi:ACS family hexuronate transporter-like MFS transporter
MPVDIPDLKLSARGSAWKWWVCGLLLLATMLNYMDRLTLNLTAKRIMADFGLDERDYGQLESAFAFAFAIGAIVAGWMADRWSVRWIYPAALLAWSVAGFASGLATGFLSLLVFRFLLGLAESGNWPCALRTTQHIVPPSERTLGNSILQSGAAFGAILTPLIVMLCIYLTGTWRVPFMVVGVLGAFWVFAWLGSVRRNDLPTGHIKPGPSLVNILGILICLLGLDLLVHAAAQGGPRLQEFTDQVPGLNEVVQFVAANRTWLPLLTKVFVTVVGIAAVFFWLQRVTHDDTALPRHVFVRRFWVLMALVVTLNSTWHFLRAWLPLFLQNQRGYSENETSWFFTAYYVVTDVGCITAGFVTLALARGGLSVHGSRVAVFCACAALTTLSLLVPLLAAGPVLILLLLVIGFGALGLFPNYYTFSQEITVQYQGKVTGALGCISWLSMSLLHEAVGDSIKQTGSYDLAMSAAGILPLIGVGALLLFWRAAEGTPQPVPLLEAVPTPSADEAIRPTADGIKPAEDGIKQVSAPGTG